MTCPNPPGCGRASTVSCEARDCSPTANSGRYRGRRPGRPVGTAARCRPNPTRRPTRSGLVGRRHVSGLSIQLLGRPTLRLPEGEGYRFRSRKTWALLAYLLLTERPPARSELAALLFADADDPLRALRWCLAEVRRGLGQGAVVDGDPVVLELPPGSSVDAHLVIGGAWAEPAELPGLGSELLDGVTVRGAGRFDTWLLSAQRHLVAASESILHEAALGLMARGETKRATTFVVRALSLNPLDENHQALLIRLYRLAGDDAAAERQFR